MTPKKRVTHQDVARLAGVSTAVVSYVINNGPRSTSPKARERVLRAIKELDYHPNAFARALRANRTNTIAVIDKDHYGHTVFSTPYTAPILTGMAAQFKAQGYYILVYPMNLDEDLHDVETLLRSGRLDGIVVRLVEEPPATNELLELIRATSIPCVCIEVPGAPQFGFSAVTYDNVSGAYQATRYLLQQGHQRIGHIAGDRRYMTALHRLEGYKRALADYHVPVDERLIAEGDWSTPTAQASVAQLLSLADPPTAIFAASDRLAIAALEELRSRHYRIPEDIAVIGFDDIELAHLIAPPLTTVHIPLYEIGQRAAELVLGMIQSEQGEAARTDVLPVELVRRGSA
jgi:LacI family transcriptional regulator